jgi:hypothetical protein
VVKKVLVRTLADRRWIRVLSINTYVDDIVVKTRKVDDLVNDLRVAFDCLRANRVKLNPEKCVFGVPRGMLLRYIVSQLGIEPNPEKVSALD